MRWMPVMTIAVVMSAHPGGLGAQRPSTAADPKAPPPTSALDSLISAFSGRWSLTLAFEPSKETPRGLEGTGEETWHAGPQGLTLTDEEVFSVGPQTLIVVGLLWRDLKTGELHALDCSNQNASTCDLKGAIADVVVHWTGGELTIDEKELSQGTIMTSRVTWSDITANSFTETGYLAPSGGPFQKIMTIHATRAPAK